MKSWQFSLRGMFWLVAGLAVALWIVLWIWRMRNEAERRIALQGRGAKFAYKDGTLYAISTCKEWNDVNNETIQLTHQEVRWIAQFKSLQLLDLYESGADDGDLRALTALKDVTHLDLSCSKVSAGGCAQLAEFKNLDTLSLAHTGIG